ncbi:Ig-like domain-containing protein [Maribacter algicola]|uniref:Ig-like domain-containing protein n=1 Tax=Meishania litoralis TaxID=3434685 RepID=A0ACC7LGC6_9FLAO
MSIITPHIKRLFVFGLAIGLLSFIPFFAGPGLTSPEPMGKFLNGIFPDQPTSDKPYRIAFPNLSFDSPLTFSPIPNTNVLVVGQRNGIVYWFQNDDAVSSKNLVADFSDEVGIVWDGGFLGLAIHPEFGQAGKNHMYMWYTTKDAQGRHYPNAFLSGFGCNLEDYWGSFLILKRIEVNPVTYEMVPGSDLTMMKMRMYGSTHRGGGMVFGDDGFLYIATADQCAYSKPQDIAGNLDGGVLRIDVDMDPVRSHAPIRKMPEASRFSDELSGVGYFIPNDNPFLSPTGENFEEYYTLGHRNPHRMTKDRETGIMYIGEIGENTHEEINVVSKGKNYGWPIFEGNIAGGSSQCTTMYNGMPHEHPLVAFPRADANAIIGGFVYRGNEMPDFYGKYICADYGVGEEIWAVDTATGEYEFLTQFSPTDIISFGEDQSGELYLLSEGDGVYLYRLTQNSGNFSEVPLLLSQTGIFEDLLTLTPNDGVIPYDMTEAFWSDGALKRRWMAIPNDGTHDTPEEQIEFSENGDWEFPVGSVLIKHLELPVDEGNPSVIRRLETRLVIKAEDESYYYLVYKWNEQGTDAVLLYDSLDEQITVTKEDGSTRTQVWHYPNSPECFACHDTGGSLGPRTRYLNKNIVYDKTGIDANQLVTLSHLGILNESIDDAKAAQYQTHKAMNDPTATLDEKARSYLDLNCAYCHRPGRSGERAQFDLRLFNTLEQTGLLTAGTNTPIGVQGEKILVPGDASKSILYHRTNSVNTTIMMPPLAKNLVDEKAVALIEEWIDQLNPNTGTTSIQQGSYRLTNVGSGLVMDVFDSSTESLADIIQSDLSGATSQQFMFESAESGFFTIEAEHSSYYLDVEQDGQSSGTNVLQYPYHGNVNQLWAVEYLGNDEYAIKSKSNGLYLGVENNSTSSGASIKTYLNDGSDFMRWRFTSLSTIAVAGVSLSSGELVLNVGENVDLTALIDPTNASNTGVSWSTSDPNIAAIDANGRVTAIAEGTVTITVTTDDGGFTATREITVSDGIVQVSGVSLASDEVTLAEDETIGFTAIIAPSNATDSSVVWSTSDASIATVDGNGLVTAVSEGTASIMVTTNDGGFSATTVVNVNNNVVHVTGVSVSLATAVLYVGETLSLNATISPANADNGSVVWSTSDENIATVDAEGNVTALSEGSVSITVTTTEGSFTDISEITVQELEEADFEPIIYPNPTEGQLNVDLRTYESTEVSVTLFNSLRQKLAGKVFDMEHGAFEEIDVSTLSNGVYYITFESDGHRDAKAFIVNR